MKVLENFIRNSAKHNSSKFVDNDLEILIQLNENENDPNSYLFLISDNVSEVDKEFRKKSEVHILNSNNNLATSDLGILDFKISSALLVNKSITELNKNDFDIIVNDDKKLIIQFRILKPKFICFIGFKNK
jgi:hypothetical protein